MDLTIYTERLERAASLLQQAQDLISEVRDDMVVDCVDAISDPANEVVAQVDNTVDYDLNDIIFNVNDVIDFLNGRESSFTHKLLLP